MWVKVACFNVCTNNPFTVHFTCDYFSWSPTDSITDAMESVSIKTEGDMSNLDFRARISLALLLDPLNKGADWRYIHVYMYH